MLVCLRSKLHQHGLNLIGHIIYDVYLICHIINDEYHLHLIMALSINQALSVTLRIRRLFPLERGKTPYTVCPGYDIYLYLVVSLQF